MEVDLTTLKRIERLPFSRFHWRLLWIGGLGYTFDAMDGAMIAFILPVVSSLRGLTNQQTGLLASSAMIDPCSGPSSRARRSDRPAGGAALRGRLPGMSKMIVTPRRRPPAHHVAAVVDDAAVGGGAHLAHDVGLHGDAP